MSKQHDIAAYVAEKTGVSVETMLKRRRIKQHVYARSLVIYIQRKTTTDSLCFIGNTLGMDHTSVMHSIRIIEALTIPIRGKVQNQDLAAIVAEGLSRFSTPLFPVLTGLHLKVQA
jgi:hypothetical protein